MDSLQFGTALIIFALFLTSFISISLYLKEKYKPSNKNKFYDDLASKASGIEEFRAPFKCAKTFKAMLSNEVFGPVHPLYIDYFNDLYNSNSELNDKVTEIINANKKGKDKKNLSLPVIGFSICS